MQELNLSSMPATGTNREAQHAAGKAQVGYGWDCKEQRLCRTFGGDGVAHYVTIGEGAQDGSRVT
jgi:hypothetical protein